MTKKRRKTTRIARKQHVRGKESISIKSLTIEILQKSATPDRYQTKAKNTVKRNIGNRTIQGSAIGSGLNKNLVNRAIIKTLGRKYKRIIK